LDSKGLDINGRQAASFLPSLLRIHIELLVAATRKPLAMVP